MSIRNLISILIMTFYVISISSAHADTVVQLKEKLQKAGIEIPKKALKADLEKLLAEAQGREEPSKEEPKLRRSPRLAKEQPDVKKEELKKEGKVKPTPKLNKTVKKQPKKQAVKKESPGIIEPEEIVEAAVKPKLKKQINPRLEERQQGKKVKILQKPKVAQKETVQKQEEKKPELVVVKAIKTEPAIIPVPIKIEKKDLEDEAFSEIQDPIENFDSGTEDIDAEEEAELAPASFGEKPNSQQCLDFLKKWTCKVGFKVKSLSKVLYRWIRVDTKLILRDVICGDYDRIELHGLSEETIEIKTYDGFTVSLPRSFLTYIKQDFDHLDTIDLSNKPFVTGNALYVIYSALAEKAMKADKIDAITAVDPVQFQTLAMKYWGEIMLLAQYFGIQEENISSLRDFMAISITQLVAHEIDKIVTKISTPFAEEVDLQEDIKDLVMQALASNAG